MKNINELLLAVERVKNKKGEVVRQNRRKPYSVLGLISLLTIMFSSMTTIAQNNIGQLDDRTRAPGCYRVTGGGWGQYNVLGGAENSIDVHDPRCERRGLLPKIDVNNVTTFEATYRIRNADLTTIAQILNYDERSVRDKHKPVVFILAKKNGNRWDIFDQGKHLATVGRRSTFKLRITSYSRDGNMYSDIYINGTRRSVKRHLRVGTHSQMRYGNYHHGDGTARIRVKDVSFRTGR